MPPHPHTGLRPRRAQNPSGKRSVLNRQDCGAQGGFTLVEALVALSLLSLGLLAAGQLIGLALQSESLARSQCLAVLAAQSKIELLADQFQINPLSPEMGYGSHGPDLVEYRNPHAGTVLNRFAVSWTVTRVADPRTDKVLHARNVRVMVEPVDRSGIPNAKNWLNKPLGLSCTLSGKELQ